MERTEFYLNLKENKLKYSPNDYPLTHLINLQGIKLNEKLEGGFQINKYKLAFIIISLICITSQIPYISNATIFGFIAVVSLSLYLLLKAYYNFKTKYIAFPLMIPSNIKKQLKLLNYNIPLHEQLLKLDVLIKNTLLHFRDKLFIVENRSKEKFVVILSKDRERIKITDKTKPFKNSFTIIPVSDIKDINTNGIYYKKFEKWPKTMGQEKTAYANWLHERLLKNSESYKNMIEEKELNKLIKEEELKYLERRPYLAYDEGSAAFAVLFSRYSTNTIYDNPVSTPNIAKFRLQHNQQPKIVNKKFSIDNKICTVCQEKFKVDQQYAIWPCLSTTPHPFHFNCILDSFRRNINCPNCREPATF